VGGEFIWPDSRDLGGACHPRHARPVRTPAATPILADRHGIGDGVL